MSEDVTGGVLVFMQRENESHVARHFSLGCFKRRRKKKKKGLSSTRRDVDD